MARAATPEETRRHYVPASGSVLAAIEKWLTAYEGTDDFAAGVAWHDLENLILETPLVVYKHGGWVYGVWKGKFRGLELRRYEDKYAKRTV